MLYGMLMENLNLYKNNSSQKIPFGTELKIDGDFAFTPDGTKLEFNAINALILGEQPYAVEALKASAKMDFFEAIDSHSGIILVCNEKDESIAWTIFNMFDENYYGRDGETLDEDTETDFMNYFSKEAFEYAKEQKKFIIKLCHRDKESEIFVINSAFKKDNPNYSFVVPFTKIGEAVRDLIIPF